MSIWAHGLIVRQIAGWISDPKTYRSFALVCKIAAEQCWYLAEYKMTEFCRPGVNNLCGRIYSAILPNGEAHGTIPGLDIGLFIRGYHQPYGSYWFEHEGCAVKVCKQHDNVPFQVQYFNRNSVEIVFCNGCGELKFAACSYTGRIMIDGIINNINYCVCE